MSSGTWAHIRREYYLHARLWFLQRRKDPWRPLSATEAAAETLFSTSDTCFTSLFCVEIRRPVAVGPLSRKLCIGLPNWQSIVQAHCFARWSQKGKFLISQHTLWWLRRTVSASSWYIRMHALVHYYIMLKSKLMVTLLVRPTCFSLIMSMADSSKHVSHWLRPWPTLPSMILTDYVHGRHFLSLILASDGSLLIKTIIIAVLLQTSLTNSYLVLICTLH